MKKHFWSSLILTYLLLLSFVTVSFASGSSSLEEMISIVNYGDEITFDSNAIVAQSGNYLITGEKRQIPFESDSLQTTILPILSGTTADSSFYEKVTSQILQKEERRLDYFKELLREDEGWNITSNCIFDAWFIDDTLIQIIEVQQAIGHPSAERRTPYVWCYLFDIESEQVIDIWDLLTKDKNKAVGFLEESYLSAIDYFDADGYGFDYDFHYQGNFLFFIDPTERTSDHYSVYLVIMEDWGDFILTPIPVSIIDERIQGT